MPFIYGVNAAALQTSNATPNTENDCFFVKPGTGRGVSVQAIYCHGKGAALTAISGITFRGRNWTATASAGGTGITPTPRELTTQASKHTAGYAVAAVTPGTTAGGTLIVIGCGAAGPGGWVAPNPDSMIGGLESAANKSFDIFNASGTASLNFELSVETVE